MTASAEMRPSAIRMVLPFVFRHWLHQPVGAAIVAGGLLGATVADLFMPLWRRNSRRCRRLSEQP